MPNPQANSTNRTGYQGSETSSAELYIYSHGDDPFLLNPAGTIELAGRRRDESQPTLIGMATNKAIGGQAGTMEATVKAPASIGFRDWIADDDWFDVVLTRHNRRFHVMRGKVDTVRRLRNVPSATTENYVIVGRDFQSVWEQTIAYYNRFSGENVVGGAQMQAFLSEHSTFGNGSVSDTVKAFLRSMLEQLGEYGRATWEMPASMPGVSPGQKFVDTFRFYDDEFTNDPERVSAEPWMHRFDGSNMWSLAGEWSDPQFCELYCDLLSQDQRAEVGPGQELDRHNTDMVVTLRDRPFPTAAYKDRTNSLLGISGSPWWNLPLYEITRQEISVDDTGRSGLERKNIFLVSPQVHHDLTGQQIQLAAPLWDKEDVSRHGARIMDVTSKYTVIGTGEQNILTMSEGQRDRCRDWFALNPYFYNGSLPLTSGRPDIKIGGRLRVTDSGPLEKDTTYYIESVGHQWTFSPGIKTTVGVTRGWEGDDLSFRSALAKIQTGQRYSIGIAATPTQSSGVDG